MTQIPENADCGSGSTQRENLGLERPANSFLLDSSLGAEPEIWS